MILIIEGLDGIGKTTLCQKLSKKLKCNYVHESYSDDNSIKTSRLICLKHYCDSNYNIVFDRCTCIDDFVYSFLNKTPSFLTHYTKEIKNTLDKCIIIHLTLDKNTHKKRFKNRGDNLIDWDMMDQIEKNYQKFYQDFNLNVNYIKLVNDNEKNINQIVRRIENDKNFTHSSK